MSEQDEFKKWRSELNCNNWSIDYLNGTKRGWQACAEHKDKKIAALRHAISDMLGYFDESDIVLKLTLIRHGLIDESGKPTKLLTGKGE